MGQKTHPIGFRVGVTENWRSNWFSARNYKENVLADQKIRNFLKERVRRAGLSKIQIERSLNNLKITLAVARPGVVIGHGGSGIELLRDELSRITGTKVDLNVEEVKESDHCAELVAQSIVAQIKKRRPVRRIMHNTAERVYSKGVKGVKIVCSGRINGAEIARSEKTIRGSIPLQKLRAQIDFARDTAHTTYGTVGVKVWIHKGQYADTKKDKI